MEEGVGEEVPGALKRIGSRITELEAQVPYRTVPQNINPEMP